MKFNLGSKVKKLIQNWLEIVPAADQTIVLQEKLSRELETLRSQIWYRGDASELHQFFKQLQFNSGGFWASDKLFPGKSVIFLADLMKLPCKCVNIFMINF